MYCRSCNLASRRKPYRPSDIQGLEKLPNDPNDIIGSTLSNQIRRNFTVEDFCRENNHSRASSGWYKFGQLINDVSQIQKCSFSFRLRESLPLVPSRYRLWPNL